MSELEDTDTPEETEEEAATYPDITDALFANELRKLYPNIAEVFFHTGSQSGEHFLCVVSRNAAAGDAPDAIPVTSILDTKAAVLEVLKAHFTTVLDADASARIDSLFKQLKREGE